MSKLNDIGFTLGQGGSGRIADGIDHISGLMFFNNSAPALFPSQYSSGGVAQLLSTQDAEAMGIVNDYSDETRATGTLTVTSTGGNGDTISVFANEYTGGTGKGSLLIGIYTKLSTDTTLALVAQGIANVINANTNTTGYSATVSGAIVTIICRIGLGAYMNASGALMTVIVGMIARTLVGFSGGVASKLAVYHYHIDRFFKKKSDAILFVGIFQTAGASGSNAFSDLANMEKTSKSQMFQCGIWDDTQVFSLATLTKIQTQLDLLASQSVYLANVTYAADIKAISGGVNTIAGLSYNLASLTNKNVSSIIDNDGNGLGYDLFQQQGKSITALGAWMGCIAEAAISEDAGNCIPRFDCADGTEFETLMFGDGTMYDNVPDNELDQLNNNRYVFLSKVKNNTAHSWFSDDHTAIPTSSDYAWVHDSRIIYRVIINAIAALTPQLKGRIDTNTDGTITTLAIAHLTEIVGNTIKPLIASGDLAGDVNNFDASQFVLISALQKPNVTGMLIIGIRLAENAIAHSIQVPIGFATF